MIRIALSLATLLTGFSLQAQDDFVLFRDIIHETTGNQILPINLEDEDDADARIISAIANGMRVVLIGMNGENSPAHQEKRINEVSRHFEDGLHSAINTVNGITCERPRTEEGKFQASGYPDLKIIDDATGRVAYLDPKLVGPGSFNSSLRTFYFTPKTTTNKVLEDAHHLLVGIEHDGNTGLWKFTGWKLVDLHNFRVRLKMEYQAGNRELYQDEQIVVEEFVEE